MGLPIRDERRDNRVGEGVRCGACERPNGVGTDHERSTPARRPAASASRQPWEPDGQRHADRAMAVRGYRRRAALVLHRRRTPHRVADRCGHGSSQGDGVSVAARTVARRSSASITVAGVSRATPQMPNLMLLQGLFATLNSDISGLLPSWMRGWRGRSQKAKCGARGSPPGPGELSAATAKRHPARHLPADTLRGGDTDCRCALMQRAVAWRHRITEGDAGMAPV